MKYVNSAILAVVLVSLALTASLAQETGMGGPAMGGPVAGTAVGYKAPFSELRALAAGLTIIGAAMGIGGLTKSAVESMARQPEMAGDIRTSMIISAALIEGVTFFALIIIGFVLTS